MLKHSDKTNSSSNAAEAEHDARDNATDADEVLAQEKSADTDFRRRRGQNEGYWNSIYGSDK